MDDRERPKQAENSGEPASRDAAGESTAADYLRAAKALVTAGRKMEAFRILQQAIVQHSSHPVLLSYYGWLDADAEGRYRSGIEACLNALAIMEKQSLHGADDSSGAVNAVLYLNLGRAYLAAGKKKEAVNAFTSGLKHSKANTDLLREMRAMGIRKQVPLPFLSRSNLINKFLGILLHRPQKTRNL